MGPMKATPSKKQQSIASFFTPKTVNGVGSTSTKRPDDELAASQSVLPSNPKRPLAEDTDAVNVSADRPGKRIRSDGEPSSFFSENKPEKSTTATKSIAESSKLTIPRTEQFLYSGSSQVAVGEEESRDNVNRETELLHRKFERKLGHADSLAQIKKRNWHITEETEALDDGDGDDADSDDEPTQAKTKRKGAKTGKLTPMEIQMLEIKRKHLDAILIVEVGYKMKFFGEDARIAAKELGIVCIPGKMRFDEHPSESNLDRFATASIPVHRLPVHAKRLVQAGHKVGVVRQIETAALKKAGDNRNTPFIRKLTNLYTKGTYIDDIDGLNQPGDAPIGGAPASGYLLCITETKSKGSGTDEKVDVGILAVQPATGDVIYDNFEDGFMRSEIETRLLHISPCEFLIVGELTKASEKLIQHLSSSTVSVYGDKIRIERVERKKTIAAESYSHVAQFYAAKMKNHIGDERASSLLDKVLNLAEPVTVCLSAMITHLEEYGLEHVFDLTKYFQSFSARSHMLLNGNTLTSLELYHNSTDHSEKGSLFWALDKTQTKFGQRLLRKWVGRPLLDQNALEERVAAVEELKDGNQTIKVDKLKSLLMKVKTDLERSLIRIYYGKCTRPELLTVLQTLQRIANEFVTVKSPAESGFKSSLLNNAVAALPVIGDTVIGFLDKINLQAARDDDKYAFFRETEETEAVADHKGGIAAVETDLDDHRPIAAAKIKKKNINYVMVAGIEYLIEVHNTDLKYVPASWAKISGTKKVSRFHTPEVVNMIRERDQHKESLAAACDTAFSNLLAEIASHYQSFRDCVSALATLDCLLSLATIASQPGYVKPFFSPTTEITITDGRHPIAEQLLLDAYVPNNTKLSSNSTRALLITGPNMGGKSSYVRSIALICIMAQIGSYVPAASAHLGLLDAVFTRMGAFDNMLAGESTFMVELSETATILKAATPRSLVILDELGRGTSTHDGVAIANAVLEHVVRDIKCLTLFITHYQTLASLARGFEHSELQNVHMKFDARPSEGRKAEEKDGDEEITFLFLAAPGIAHRSYGLNVARLARVPRAVLDLAAVKSREMEEDARQKRIKALARLVGRMVKGPDSIKAETGMQEVLDQVILGIEQL